MTQKIIFRADGNSMIGLGHFFRVLALADMLKREFSCYLAIKEPDDFVKDQIKTIGIGLIPLERFDDKNVSDGQNETEVPFDLSQHLKGDEIVVIDGYRFGDNYQRQIKQTGSAVVYLDDVYKEYPYADVIINHALSASAAKYKNTPARIFAGPDFSLMRKEFLEAARKRQPKIKFDTAFVCFGGADTEELAFKTCTLLANSDTPVSTIHVLNSSSYKGSLDKFQQLAARSGKNVMVHQNLSATEIIELMMACDFALVSASNISYECACTGLPMVVGYYVDHQFQFYEALRQQPNVEGIGKWQLTTENSLKTSVDRLIQNYNPKVKNFIDGLQPKRFIALFKSITADKAISGS